jgi:FtsZ-interacting cell division protein ZipA
MINELQLGLILIGAVVILGVVFYNWMQQRRYRQIIRKENPQTYRDPSSESSEKSVGVTQKPVSRGEPAEPRIDPPLFHEPETVPVETGRTTEQSAITEKAGNNQPVQAVSVLPDAKIKIKESDVAGIDNRKLVPAGQGEDSSDRHDYVVCVDSAVPIVVSELIDLLQRRFDFGKPLRWFGKRTAIEPWEPISLEAGDVGESASARPDLAGLTCLKGCLQLTDRSGPVSEVNLSEFCDVVQNFATYIKAASVCPDIRQAYVRAVELDRFCADVDVMIGVNIISKDGGAYTGTKIRGLAEAAGFRLDPKAGGGFRYSNEDGVVLFSIANQEAALFTADSMRTLTTRGITLLLDIPRTPGGEKAFDQMVHIARNFSATLGGIMVDDNRVPLSDNAISKIRQQLSGIQAAMKAYGIAPGGEIALRLFV